MLEIKTIHLKLNEMEEIELENRGSAGLTLYTVVEDNEIVSIDSIPNSPSDHVNSKPGDSLIVKFRIQAKTVGKTKVKFYETRVWDKSYNAALIKELLIMVG